MVGLGEFMNKKGEIEEVKWKILTMVGFQRPKRQAFDWKRLPSIVFLHYSNYVQKTKPHYVPST